MCDDDEYVPSKHGKKKIRPRPLARKKMAKKATKKVVKKATKKAAKK